MWAKLYDMAPVFIPIMVLCFQVIGLFGNINLMVAITRNKHFHTKHGVLLALTSLYHSFCLLGELANAAVGLYGNRFQRRTCFTLMVPYMIFCCMQSTMFFVISLNKLLSIIYPIRVMVIGLWVYVLVASIPPVFYAALILSINVFMIFRSEDNPKVKHCNPFLSMEPLAKDIWTYWNIFLIIVVLCMQAAIYMIVRAKDASNIQIRKNVNQNDDKNHVPCILVVMSTFTCTWGTFMLSQAAVSWMQPSEATVVIQAYSVIFALMTYSMNFYIYFAKHDAYREAFLEQWLHSMPAWYRRRVSSYISSQPTSRTNLDQDVAHQRSGNPSVSQYLENLERDMSKIESQKI